MTDPRPRPKYGEYAPITPPAESPADVAAPTPEAAPAAPFAPPVASEQIAGEAPSAPSAPAKRKSRDLIITTALLVIGVWDVVTAFSQYANLPVLIQQAYDQLGVGDFTSDAAALSMGAFINGGRVVILVAVIILSLWRISLGKLSFWIPLAGAVLAGLFVGVCTVIVMINDPAFVAFSQATGS